MTILEQAEELRSQAIELLLKERGTIDQKLDQLGYQTGAAPEKKNGRTVSVTVVWAKGIRFAPAKSVLQKRPNDSMTLPEASTDQLARLMACLIIVHHDP